MASSTIKPIITKSFINHVRKIYSSGIGEYGPDTKVFTTPLKIRNQGMIACCECGVINSDSLKQCKKCKQDLIYIRDEQQ